MTSDFASAEAEVDSLLDEPSLFSAEYEDFLQAAKTASMLHDWMEEAPEEIILEKYGVRPGELRAKLETADWLLYSATELCRLVESERREFLRARTRLKYGVKTELIPLLRLRGIGRVRARALHNAGFISLAAINSASETKLKEILGPKITQRVREQLSGGAIYSKNKLSSYDKK